MPGSQFESRIREVLADRQKDVGIDFEGTPFTWAEVRSTADAVEAAVAGIGLVESDRVGFMGRNLPMHIAALWGVFLSGRCLSNIHAYQPSTALAGDFLTNRWPLVLGDQRDWTDEVIAAAESSGTVGYAITNDPQNPLEQVTRLSNPGHEADRIPRGDVVVQLLSSGTTGTPRRIDLSRKAIDEMIARTMTQYELAGPAAGSGMIMPWPLSSLGGTNAVLPAAVLGQRLAIQEKFNAPGMLGMIEKYRPAFLSIPPSALAMLLQLNPPREALACIKLFSSGSAPLDPNVREELWENYGVPAAEFYGATEFAGIVSGWTPEDLMRVREKAGSVGRALPGISIRVVSPGSGEVLPPGEAGLVEALVPRTGDDWVRTNDLGKLDEDGFLYIEGRADDMISRGGLKVFPEEIVKALRLHPKVGDAAVIGIPDARLGTVPAAAVETRTGQEAPTGEELDEFLRTRLSPYKIPVKYRVVDEIPRTQSMKPQRQRMLQLFDS